MDALLLIFFLFIIFVGGGRLLGRAFGNILFPQKKDKYTFIDKTVHYHTHIHNHEHKSITIIDDKTRQKILELKETNKKAAG